MHKPNAFSKIIRKALADKEISEAEGAKIVKCSQPCINRWINGWTTPRIKNLRGISRLTGHSVERLVELYEEGAA